MDTNVTYYVDTLLRAYLVPFGWKLLGAAAVWLIGLAVINVVRNASRRLMAVRRFDATLAGYLDTSLGIVLKILSSRVFDRQRPDRTCAERADPRIQTNRRRPGGALLLS
jgi:Mechanosensitive ion channel, conserved TM helix